MREQERAVSAAGSGMGRRTWRRKSPRQPGPCCARTASAQVQEPVQRHVLERAERYHRDGHQDRPGSHRELDRGRVTVGAPRLPWAGSASSSATTSATVPRCCQSGSPRG